MRLRFVESLLGAEHAAQLLDGPGARVARGQPLGHQLVGLECEVRLEFGLEVVLAARHGCSGPRIPAIAAARRRHLLVSATSSLRPFRVSV